MPIIPLLDHNSVKEKVNSLDREVYSKKEVSHFSEVFCLSLGSCIFSLILIKRRFLEIL